MRKTITRTIAISLVAGLGLTAPVAGASAQNEVFTVRGYSEAGSYLAGIAAQSVMDASRAADYFMRTAERDWDNPVLVGRAFAAYLSAGRVDKAASLAQHLLDLEPGNEMALLTLGTVALKERRYSSANQLFSRVSGQSLLGITAGILQAWGQVGSGDLAAANATLDRISDEGFGEFLAYHRGLISELGGDRTAALGYARQAYEFDPFTAAIAETYIRMLGNAGQFDEARQELDRLATQGHMHPLLQALREPIEAGRRPGLFAPDVPSGAAELLRSFGPALAGDDLYDLGLMYLQLGRYLNPGSAPIQLTLGELLMGAQRYDEAQAAFESVPRNSPMYTSALIRQAEVIDAKGDRDAAIVRLRNIVNANPGSLEAHGVLGNLLSAGEQWSEAAEAYSDLLEMIDGNRPGDWIYFYRRGIAYERDGQWPQAEADFLKALELNPDHPQVLNYLGYSWVDQGMHLERALEMIQRAVERAPRDGYITDSLGWAYYKLGRYEEAVAELERAVNLMPDDPILNDHLGDAYWRAGRQREAMFQWRIAIHVGEEGDDVTEQAAAKLANGLDDDAPAGD